MQQILNENHREAVKSEAPQTEYDVVVSILNPRPDIMNAKWNVRMAVESMSLNLISNLFTNL